MNRMNRDQFLATLAPLDDMQLRKLLWTLYWRGGATVRERIETEVKAGISGQRPRAEPVSADPSEVRREAEEFATLCRSGAYLGGDRRVTPKERTRWRYTYRQLFADARLALRDDDLTDGTAAMETLVDLACDLRGHDYVRSEDPVEAAKVIISDEVALLWNRVLEHEGFPAFAAVAAPQLIRWEARFGWTRSGWGQVAEKETKLVDVVAPLLRIRDAWVTFADHYLNGLDAVASSEARQPSRSSWMNPDRRRVERAEALSTWNLALLHRLDDDTHGRADRLTTHRAFEGPELTYLQAHLAHRRGDVDRAHQLMFDCLTNLPGHDGFLTYAAEIEAPLPPRAQKVAEERAIPGATLAGVVVG